jgi:hypothetical protein
MVDFNNKPPTRVPVVFSSQLQAVVDRGVPCDYSIAGIPFRIKPDQQDPLLWDLRSSEKEQFDSSQQAGENSFGDWWLRSQPSFHGGQGQKYLDSSDPEVARIRFEESSGVYPHEPGQLTLAGSLTSTPLGRKLAEQVVWSNVDKLATASNSTNQVYVSTLPALASTTTVTLGASGIPTAMTSDGINLYVAIADKIYRINSAGTATLIHSTDITFTGPVALGFAKQRLILCIANKVWELDPNPPVPPVTAHTVHYTNPSTDYIYTAVAEGPNGIYLSGYSGTKSDMSSMSVTESGGTVVLGPPVVQLRTPPRELIQDVFFYVGSLFAMATTNGARVGSFTPYGQPQLGTLLMEGTPARSLTGDGSLIYVGAQDSVWWIDLATPTDQVGGYSHSQMASGVGSLGTDPVHAIEVYQSLVFGCTDDGRLISQPTFTPTANATLTSSWSRFGTTEPKRLHYVSVEGDFPIVAGIDNVLSVTVENAEGETVQFGVAGGASNFEFSCQGLSSSQAFRLHFTLRDSDPGHGVLLRSWQMKALPCPARFPEHTLPLMCNDTERGNRQEEIGYRGFAKDRLLALLEYARRSDQVTVQDKTFDINYQAVISRVQFRQDVGPGDEGKAGGVLNVVLKQV